MMISLDKTYRQIIIQKSHRHEVKSLILVNSVRKEVSHLDLRGKAGCVSYVRQGRTTHIIIECIEINVINIINVLIT